MRIEIVFKILIDIRHGVLLENIGSINETNHENKIQLMHLDKMIEFKDILIMNEGKHLL